MLFALESDHAAEHELGQGAGSARLLSRRRHCDIGRLERQRFCPECAENRAQESETIVWAGRTSVEIGLRAIWKLLLKYFRIASEERSGTMLIFVNGRCAPAGKS